MNTQQLKSSLLLVLTSFIWGVAFVAQSAGGKEIGPHSFICIRYIMGAIILFFVICILDKKNKRTPMKKEEKKTQFIAGIACGLCLFTASTMQQLGLYYGAQAGKAGFLTACYILIVPILGLFLRKKCGLHIWVSVLIALAGLSLLCGINGDFQLEKADIFLMLCAFVFSLHILVIDHFSPKVDGVKLSCIQFFVAGILGIGTMFYFDMNHSLEGAGLLLESLSTLQAWIPVLYAGLLSSCVGYTLQIIGQRGLDPSVASLIMSLESVFSVLAGWVILGETLSRKELMGCIFIFVAILLAQFPVEKLRKAKSA